MNPIFAQYEYSPPAHYDGRCIFLLAVLALLAYLISPASSMERKEREGLAVVYPALVLVYWYLFQAMRLGQNSYYYPGFHDWPMIISLAGGAIFSVVVIRGPGIGRKLYGGLFLGLFGLLLSLTVYLAWRQHLAVSSWYGA